MSEWKILFYHEEDGTEPVKDFIVNLPYKTRAEIIHVLELLHTFDIQLGKPYVEKLDTEIWELRIKHSKDYFRIFYSSVPTKTFLLLHAILKKTDKTPQKDIDIARSRLYRYNLR